MVNMQILTNQFILLPLSLYVGTLIINVYLLMVSLIIFLELCFYTFFFNVEGWCSSAFMYEPPWGIYISEVLK